MERQDENNTRAIVNVVARRRSRGAVRLARGADDKRTCIMSAYVESVLARCSGDFAAHTVSYVRMAPLLPRVTANGGINAGKLYTMVAFACFMSDRYPDKDLEIATDLLEFFAAYHRRWYCRFDIAGPVGEPPGCLLICLRYLCRRLGVSLSTPAHGFAYQEYDGTPVPSGWTNVLNAAAVEE